MLKKWWWIAVTRIIILILYLGISICKIIFFLLQMVKTVEDYLEDYNQVNTNKMNLVLFMDAIKHLSRIARIIRQPMGNALLLGMGGSGRQSLTRLAAHM